MGGKPPVEASRVPVGHACRDSVMPMAGNLCAICGGRMVTLSRVEAEPERWHDIFRVDDVFTTGTTVSGRARVLRRAGEAGVYAAAVARALKADRIGIQREVREAA
jgi:hypothetical protein